MNYVDFCNAVNPSVNNFCVLYLRGCSSDS